MKIKKENKKENSSMNKYFFTPIQFFCMFSFLFVLILFVFSGGVKNNSPISIKAILSEDNLDSFAQREIVGENLTVNDTIVVKLIISPKGNSISPGMIFEKLPSGVLFVESNIPLSIQDGQNLIWIFEEFNEPFEISYSIYLNSTGPKNFFGKYLFNSTSELFEGNFAGESKIFIASKIEDIVQIPEEENPAEEPETPTEEPIEEPENLPIKDPENPEEPSEPETICSGQTLTEINIFENSSVVFGEETFYDSCVENISKEYYCRENVVENVEFYCSVCDEENNYCLKQYDCLKGETINYTCSDDSIVEHCSCVDNSWSCIENPSENCIAEETIYSLFKNILTAGNLLNYTLVIGENADVSDSIAAVDLAGAFGITKVVLDSGVDSNENLIIVGGNCVNSKAALLLGLGYGTENCFEEFSSTLPVEGSIIEVVKKNNKNNIIIAGLEAQDTRKAARAILNLDREDIRQNLEKGRAIIRR